jgi:hypothetical protein
MRTTVNVPDALFRKTKAVAALRGSSMKDLIVHAIEREVNQAAPDKRKRVQLPILKNWKGPKLDLTEFDFDELFG